MSETTQKWTPGKWELAHDMDGDYMVLAGSKIITITSNDHEDDEANALLISKSPAMYELLRDIVTNYRSGYDVLVSHGIDQADALLSSLGGK